MIRQRWPGPSTAPLVADGVQVEARVTPASVAIGWVPGCDDEERNSRLPGSISIVPFVGLIATEGLPTHTSALILLSTGGSCLCTRTRTVLAPCTAVPEVPTMS